VQKIDTHAVYALKEMNKKQVKANQSEVRAMAADAAEALP